MPLEIERKFLVDGDAWRAAARRRERYAQGYLAGSERCSVRVRLGDGRAWLGVKGRLSAATRLEYEYPIPPAEAEELLERLCALGTVEKWRHFVPYAGREWEVDEFLGDNSGLVVAELELESEDARFERPAWIGAEVTSDPRYLNTALAQRPWRTWTEKGGRTA
jgi:adenylate cyclase